MIEERNIGWLPAAIVCICGGAFTAGLRARNVPLVDALIAGALVAILAGTLVGMLLLGKQRNWRFSLRFLLIVMTFAALLLGVVVFFANGK